MILNNLKKVFFKRKKYNTRNIQNILNNIIKISYSSSFNKKFKISTNFNSRYEIILILFFLIHLKLKNKKENKIKLQIMCDYLFDYIDYSLRELGTGDLSVGKKVKTMAQIFSKRMKLYDKSISVGENSKVKIKNVDIDNSEIGLAVKDNSDAEINYLQIKNAYFAFKRQINNN